MNPQDAIPISGSLRSRKILLVEDEALIAMLAEDVLREAGADVLGPAATVEQALALIAEHGAVLDAAVLDMNLGGRSVLPVAEALVGLGVPFALATGYAEAPLPGGLRHAGILHKPYAPEELVDLLASVMPPKK